MCLYNVSRGDELTLEALGGGGVKLTPIVFFGFKFLLLDRLPKALAQLSLFVNTYFDSN